LSCCVFHQKYILSFYTPNIQTIIANESGTVEKARNTKIVPVIVSLILCFILFSLFNDFYVFNVTHIQNDSLKILK
jgi:hypothetical protein